MDEQKVRQEVSDIIARVRISHEPEEVVDMIMSVIRDVASDEYDRGNSDGAFNESYHNATSDRGISASFDAALDQITRGDV